MVRHSMPWCGSARPFLLMRTLESLGAVPVGSGPENLVRCAQPHAAWNPPLVVSNGEPWRNSKGARLVAWTTPNRQMRQVDHSVGARRARVAMLAALAARCACLPRRDCQWEVGAVPTRNSSYRKRPAGVTVKVLNQVRRLRIARWSTGSASIGRWLDIAHASQIRWLVCIDGSHVET